MASSYNRLWAEARKEHIRMKNLKKRRTPSAASINMDGSPAEKPPSSSEEPRSLAKTLAILTAAILSIVGLVLAIVYICKYEYAHAYPDYSNLTYHLNDTCM